MTEKHIRSGMIGVCVFLTAVIIGTLAYRTGKTGNQPPMPAEQTVTAEAEDAQKETAEYYTVRLDGDVLSVYSGFGKGEEFMYTLDVRIEDISEDEESWLREGVVLNSRQELAAFEEDFAS